MSILESSELAGLQRSAEFVRNVCILAHVDHGKTTLADSLVASNGIISHRMAGKLRYMDNRQDEQERGITMKSSSISLCYRDILNHKPYLINLVDSPGHVDFSSEVSTAVRLCDGAIVVVDVVEGVCAQTRACLQQVYAEQLKPVVVLNKLDRLILEKQLTPLSAYYHIMQVLEQINAVLGAIFASDVFAKEDITLKENCESALEQVDDSELYFQPAHGNVIFCSAIDGWGFNLGDFAALYSQRLEVSVEELQSKLWGDYYYSVKQKCILSGAHEKSKKPMFVQFVLENIWSLYDVIVVRKDREKLPHIAEKLNIKLLPRDLRLTDVKAQINAVLGQWLPLDCCILELVVRHVPAPNQITAERAQRLFFPANVKLESYPSETLALQSVFQRCDAQSTDVIVYVSKMMLVHVSQFSQNKMHRPTEVDIQARREEVRRRLEERKLAAQLNAGLAELSIKDTKTIPKDMEKNEKEAQTTNKQSEYVFIAFARIFSGTLRTGDKLYVLGPKHDPQTADHLRSDAPYVSEVIVSSLYMFMGSELQAVDEVSAGNIIGIGGLESLVIKTATLSNSFYCTAFTELNIMATPIYRVAIEPVNPFEMPQLIKGLKMLNQADPCVQVSVEATGQHVISTLGEVHVEKCVRDLEENYAFIKVNVSAPIVSFRETIVPLATLDMVNEAIVLKEHEKDIEQKIVTEETPNKMCQLRVLALSLPAAAVEVLEQHKNFFKQIKNDANARIIHSEKCLALLKQIKLKLTAALEDFDFKLCPRMANMTTAQFVESIWDLGPRHCGTNILLNLSDYEHPNFWSAEERDSTSDKRHDYSNSLVNGFQLTTSAGPLCEEPMQAVCFILLEWNMTVCKDLLTQTYGPFSGQIFNAAKDACCKAFQNQPMRLVSPMYSCSIAVDVEMLGKMYAVIGRRHGKILSGDLTHGSGIYTVEAVLPVIESFNFAQEIRKQTSGLACPQLVFSHWEVLDIDPFWVPTTDEELMHFGEKADSANRAKQYIDSVRRRKGLYVNEQVVEHGEKQRTLSKKK